MTETKRARLFEQEIDILPLPETFRKELPYECKACGNVMRMVARKFHEKRCGGRIR